MSKRLEDLPDDIQSLLKSTPPLALLLAKEYAMATGGDCVVAVRSVPSDPEKRREAIEKMRGTTIWRSENAVVLAIPYDRQEWGTDNECGKDFAEATTDQTRVIATTDEHVAWFVLP
jgi:hypothetical protein